MKINWNRYKIKNKAAFIDKFISYLNFFKRFLYKHEVILLTKYKQKKYLLALKNYLNCFEKDNLNQPEVEKETKKNNHNLAYE